MTDSIPTVHTILKLIVLSNTIWKSSAGFSCLSSPCVHGVCMDDLNSTYFCYCIDGYTGIQCKTNWNECWSSPCQNDGFCIDGIAAFTCECAPGFVGDLCEQNFDECESNPCQNNGTCIDNTNGYICYCRSGYMGPHCEIDISVCNTSFIGNESRCYHGGTCLEGPGDSFSCHCKQGWTGVRCENEINECESNPCQNGAVCIDLISDYACACPFGRTGRNCEFSVEMCENNHCQNGALCLMEGTIPQCYCVPDFHGDRCQYQYNECLLGASSCINGGTCIDGIDSFICACPPAFTGIFCECNLSEKSSRNCSQIGQNLVPIKPFVPTQVPSFVTSSNNFTNATITSSHSTTSRIFEPVISTTVEDEITIFLTTVPPTTEGKEICCRSQKPEIQQHPLETSTDDVASYAKDLNVTDFAKATSDNSGKLTTLLYSTIDSADTTLPSTDFFPKSTTTMPQFNDTVWTNLSTFVDQFTTLTLSEAVDSSTESSTTLWTNLNMSTIKFPIETTTTMESPDELSTGKSDDDTNSSISQTFRTTLKEQLLTTSIPANNGFESCQEIPCKNGGLCKELKCICPFNTYGQFCQHRKTISKAAFTNDSFLKYELLISNTLSYTFTMATLSTTGLITLFHTDVVYLMVFLENGFLKFFYTCGYQSMVLSEITKPISNGNHVEIDLVMSFTNKACHANITVNNSFSLAGTQEWHPSLNQLITKKNGTLHFGRVPYNIPNSIHLPSVVNHFTGCIWNLQVFAESYDIYENAFDGFQIDECNSLACLSKPCFNDGQCSINSNGTSSWECNCQNGYTGKQCEKSICGNNPCLYGGTCIPFLNNTYICLCPFGKHGQLCENNVRIRRPYFGSTIRGLASYLAYSLPTQLLPIDDLEVSFRFQPAIIDQISILLFLGQRGMHNRRSDHFAVTFVRGYIMLTWNLGSGPRRIFTSAPLLNYTNDCCFIKLRYVNQTAWLFVENLENITGTTLGYSTTLNVLPIMYIGGHDSFEFSSLPHDLPLHSGFLGCIYDVKIRTNNGALLSLNEDKVIMGRAIGECGITECYEQTCHHGGACLHHAGSFLCVCQQMWHDPLCTSLLNPCNFQLHNCSSGSTCVPKIGAYECDCPIGKSGTFCEKDTPLNASNVNFTGKRSYLTVPSVRIDMKDFLIKIEIQTFTDNGLIYLGEIDNVNKMKICLYLYNGFTQFLIGSDTSDVHVTYITSTVQHKRGVWYRLKFGIHNQQLYLFVNDVISIKNQQKYMNENGTPGLQTISIGGINDLSNMPWIIKTHIQNAVRFEGCIRQLFINNVFIPLSKENILDGRNVHDCDGRFCEDGKDTRCENPIQIRKSKLSKSNYLLLDHKRHSERNVKDQTFLEGYHS